MPHARWILVLLLACIGLTLCALTFRSDEPADTPTHHAQLAPPAAIPFTGGDLAPLAVTRAILASDAPEARKLIDLLSPEQRGEVYAHLTEYLTQLSQRKLYTHSRDTDFVEWFVRRLLEEHQQESAQRIFAHLLPPDGDAIVTQGWFTAIPSTISVVDAGGVSVARKIHTSRRLTKESKHDAFVSNLVNVSTPDQDDRMIITAKIEYIILPPSWSPVDESYQALAVEIASGEMYSVHIRPQHQQ